MRSTGKNKTPTIHKGYAVVTRDWKAGDRVELELPMEPQRVAADARIEADAGLVALKYGPLSTTWSGGQRGH